MIRVRVDEKLGDIERSSVTFSEADTSVSEFLSQVELFEPLAEKDMEFLEANASLVHFLTGDIIIDVFQKGDHFYVLVQGIATVWISDAFNRQHCMSEFTQGDFMGESSLLAKQRGRGKHERSATVKAETPCTLIRITPEAMTSVLWKYPQIMNTLREINEARVSVVPKATDELRVYRPKKKRKDSAPVPKPNQQAPDK